MKRWTTLLIVICMLGITIPAMGAMSISKMRQNTRFLTDRMAYELKLTPRQYNDVYEVNYDFINNVRYLMDDVVRGYDYMRWNVTMIFWMCVMMIFVGYFPVRNIVVL